MDIKEILAIDPGSVHCGVAHFTRGEAGWVCDWARELAPEALFRPVYASLIEVLPRDAAEVVCEGFRLYPGLAQEQSFSRMATVEVIGVIRFLCLRTGVQYVEQLATVKRVAFEILKARAVEETWKGHGGHARDAWAHGWFRVLRMEESAGYNVR